LATPQQRWWL